jgi:apolipoprotein N-acyltransferase
LNRASAPDRAERWLHGPAVRLKERLAGVRGWRRHALAAALGALAALALPPVHAVVLLVPAFVGLVWLIDQSPRLRAAFAAGWWFGVGHFALGLYWIAFALLTDPVKFGWMIPFAVGGLSAGMALFPAVAAALAHQGWAALARARGRPAGAGRVVLFAVSWMALEWARAWVLTGFPWNLIGTVWTFSDAMIQLAAVAGVYGLSLLTVTVAALPATLADRDRESSRGAWRPVAAAFVVLALVWVCGLVRLAGADGATVPGVRLRLVQPNIPQTLKWDPAQRQQHVVKQIRMSLRPAGASARSPTHVIWAETAVPYYVANEPELLAAVSSVAPPGGAVIVGAPRTTPTPSTPFQVWNSLHAIDGAGRVIATYDKFHLVPFGEYVPLRRWLPIAKITHGATDFLRGPGPRTLAIPGLPPFSPLICYEAIFPTAVTEPGRRPGWILNLTNDAWFGISSGPHQHLAAARLRAVEEGLPLVRVANNGVSAIVDAYGRVQARLGLGREGVIDGDLPMALAAPPYGRYGDRLTLTALLAAFAAAFAGSRGRGKTG